MPVNNKSRGQRHRKPFHPKVECGICRKLVDTRGLKSHTMSHQRQMEGENIHLTRGDGGTNGGTNGGVRESGNKAMPISPGDWKAGYRDGFQDGLSTGASTLREQQAA